MENIYTCSIDAESAILEFEKELRAMITDQGIVEIELNELRRHILEKEIEKSRLTEKARKGRENTKRVESELRSAKAWFWKLKNQGL